MKEKKFFCIKLKKKSKPLDYAPIPGILGKKILQYISSEAWDMWIKKQTILINEYKIVSYDEKAQKFLLKEMKNFLFGKD